MVTTQHVIMKASALLRDCFAGKSFEAQYKAVLHFLKCHLYGYCLKTNEAMRPPEETHQEATKFMAANCPLLSSPHHNKGYILNMDQTPLWFVVSLCKNTCKEGPKDYSCPKVIQQDKEGNLRPHHYCVQ